MKIKVSCIQNCAEENLNHNLQDTSDLVRRAREAGAELICLAEFFSFLHLDDNGLNVAPFEESVHPTLSTFQSLAQEVDAWILLGSIAVSDSEGKKLNRSIMLSPQGEIIARYDKIHLFDVNLPNGEVYRESAIFNPGNEAVLAQLPWGSVGLTVCYDLRFPHLYRALAHSGAQILTVPAAFTRTTGQAHWHVMLRSRAIETGCYVVAPCQYGDHGKAKTYGHSLIIDPWGRILADGGESRGYIISEVDLSEVEKARQMIPALEHDRPYRVPDKDEPELFRQAS